MDGYNSQIAWVTKSDLSLDFVLCILEQFDGRYSARLEKQLHEDILSKFFDMAWTDPFRNYMLVQLLLLFSMKNLCLLPLVCFIFG